MTAFQKRSFDATGCSKMACHFRRSPNQFSKLFFFWWCDASHRATIIRALIWTSCSCVSGRSMTRMIASQQRIPSEYRDMSCKACWQMDSGSPRVQHTCLRSGAVDPSIPRSNGHNAYIRCSVCGQGIRPLLADSPSSVAASIASDLSIMSALLSSAG